MTTSLAAVFDGAANQLELRRFATPAPQQGEIVARVLGCTLCGSDLHTVAGRRTVATPTVLGHEIVGSITAIGDGVPACDVGGEALRVGDRVTWAIVASCGQCFLCQRGLPQKCLRAVKYGHEALRPGRELLGGLAEHCLLVPGTALVRIPDDLSLEVACPASCATATIAAALEAAGDVRDRCVLVLGAGMLGLTAAAMARVAGAGAVICVDVDETRRSRAKQFGATRVAAPAELDAVVREGSGGHGVDVVLELSGATAALEAAWPLARLGATFVLVGAVYPGAPMSWPVEQIVRRNLTLRGVHNYEPRHLATAVKFLREQQRSFPFAELVTAWFPLSDVQTAFARAREAGHWRVGVRP
jgi:putative phosphonate catabolism associated alcohol dehydrogenase